jgi:hypothetical protein
MTNATLINPSERAFYDDIEKARFQTGLDKRRWELARPRREDTWPIVRLGTTMIAAIPYLLDERYDTRRTGS